MSVDNLLRSIAEKYLYFNRVDSYIDFPGADPHDGQQLPQDAGANAAARFARRPEFSVAHYFDRCRNRTYASCFSLENSNLIWEKYGCGGTKGKVCLVFNFGKLRSRINQIIGANPSQLVCEGILCHQPFSVNFGIVEYVEWADHVRASPYMANPVQYTHF